MVVTFCLVNNAMAGWVTSGNNMYSDVTGNVGIGTTTPGSRLTLVGNGQSDGIWLSSSPAHTDLGLLNNVTNGFCNSLAKPGDSMVLLMNPEIDDPNGGGLVLGPWSAGQTGIRITPTGKVGIGTREPWKTLSIVGTSRYDGDGIWLSTPGTKAGTTDVALLNNLGGGALNGLVQAGDSMVLLMKGTKIDDPSAGGLVLGPWSAGATGVRIAPTGKVGIGTPTPSKELTVRGNIVLESKATGATVLELGEGLDYAEGFDVSKKEEVGPGTVLVIDPADAGKLTMSTKSYDTKVAGIVAGAKSLGSGVRLGTGQFDQNVALAGRVYCNVDATDTAIEPGDLLTTSATPGHAMKVSDHLRSQGAVLGKAMEPLEQGKKGQILVLVALQ